MKPKYTSAFRSAFLAFLSLAGAAWLSAEQYSHVRVVRLSFTEGTVTVQRPDTSQWSKGPVNTPIQEGFKLSTAENSYSEVEFENAFSTARLGQLSMIEFTQLALAPSGAKINRLKFDQGYGTFHFVPEADDIYELKVGETTLTPSGKSEFRVDFENGELRVEVFSGSVAFSGPLGSQIVAKNGVLDFRPGVDAQYQLAEGITKDAWDDWVANRDKVQQASQRPAGGPYSAQVGSGLYGWNDLNGHGEWGFVPGYGYGWFPDVAWGWAPYSLGSWAWYPGYGYTWLSYEPWGWLPFHYGGWGFDPTFGWFWMPGGFGTWSPGLVTWYQGPGWIGWAPQQGTTATSGSQKGGTHGGQPNCSPGQTCVTVVPKRLFQSGGIVTPRSNTGIDLARARGVQVAAPDVKPTGRALLTGDPVPQAAALLSTPATQRRGAAPLGGMRNAFVGTAPSSQHSSLTPELRNRISSAGWSPFDRASSARSNSNAGSWHSHSSAGSAHFGGSSRGEGGGSSRSAGGGGFSSGNASVGGGGGGGHSSGSGGGGGGHH
jgi:hypothetical protein